MFFNWTQGFDLHFLENSCEMTEGRLKIESDW